MQNLRLDNLEILAAIVRAGGFRAAAIERGVSSSALSQSISTLENVLGIRLLNRTTRSVSPTDAGKRLLRQLEPALADIKAALDDLNQLREQPSGTIRINAPAPAVDHILCPIVFDFMRLFPEVNFELISDAAIIDIVKHEYDAGVRFGKQLEQDMIAVPLGPTLRYAIVASPEYLRQNGTPSTPHDLIDHNCIQRRFPGGTYAVWHFEKDGGPLEITPTGRLTLSTAHQELQAALASQGIAHVFEDYAQTHLATGALVEILADWSPQLPSWFLYYPNRRHPSAAMQAFLQHIRGYSHGLNPVKQQA